jgi:hypothetical protein
VIPRFVDDTHFPQPVWGPRQRDVLPQPLPEDFVASLAGDLAAMLGPPAAT